MSEVRLLDGAGARAHVAGLGAVLHDCVAAGASVSFMADFTPAEAEDFFREAAEAVAAGRRALFAAFDRDRVVGTVQLVPAAQPNQPHRADIAKLLVHPTARGTGVGRRLLLALEAEAAARGRTLLCLDTAAGEAGERLYERLGYRRAGVIPGYALYPDGRPCDTVVFWKDLGSP